VEKSLPGFFIFFWLAISKPYTEGDIKNMPAGEDARKPGRNIILRTLRYAEFFSEK